MKRLFFINLLLIFGSCYFNTSISNEESEKEKGEKIANIFYEYIINQNYDGSIKPYLSKELLVVTPINRMDSLLSLINNRSGYYKSRELEKWSTKRQKGTDELWECVLIYSVQYEKGKSTELFKLIKENDSIKILNYNFRSSENN